MTGATQPLLEVEGVTVAFGGIQAVHDVSLAVERGELFGLIGPNGAGKTSLLNAVSGVVPARTGTVRLEGRDITSEHLRRRVGLGVARSFQGVELFHELNVVDNLLLARHHLMKTGVIAGGAFFGRARREEVEHRARVEDVIEFFELGPYRAVAAGSLPFGVQKIVGLARGLCAEPCLLLLDEVASGLNREEKQDLARYLLRIKHELGLTMIWVEHDVRLVTDLADRIAALDHGELLAAGLPEDVLRLPEVQSSFLGVKIDRDAPADPDPPTSAPESRQDRIVQRS
jgi:branched-chain amino acid transport system ATP-binding protein